MKTHMKSRVKSLGTVGARLIRSTALVGALGIAILAGFASGAARAQDDEPDSIWNLDKRIMNNVMHGLGLKNGTEDEIEYRERSPLVVPPSRDLPPPQNSAAARAPNWPVDPDVARKQAKKSRNRNPDAAYDPDATFGRALRPSQLGGGTGTATTGTIAGPGSATGNSMETAQKPSALGYKGGLFSSIFKTGNDDEVGTFVNEPPRTNLTAPPTGYQTPSPNQPYGTTKRIDWGKAAKPEDRAVGSE